LSVDGARPDDLHFKLKFTKKRMRTPDNWADFETKAISLLGDEWLVGAAPASKEKTGRPAKKQDLAYEALTSIVAQHGEPLPSSWKMPTGLSAVSVETLKRELLSRGIVDKDGKNPSARHSEIITGLKHSHRAAERDGRIWPIIVS
jgi:hypothetical protein